MKTISEAQRIAIDNLRKIDDQNAEPTWRISIFRDKEKMLGIMSGDRITEGPPDDLEMAIAQRDSGRYDVVFVRGGTIYGMVSSAENEPRITWGEPEALFAGNRPDIDFDGSFSTVGQFTPTDLLMVYENPAGTMKFRRRSGSVWGSAVTIGSGTHPSICRGWADPPSVGTQDMGYIVAFTRGGDLYYRYSEDHGATWSPENSDLNVPAGGNKTNVQVIRLADYTHGFVYDYDNGINSEVWFHKTTRKYVNIASPDETFIARAGGYRHQVFSIVELETRDHTLTAGALGYRDERFDRRNESPPDETFSVDATGFQQIFYTGVAP